MEDIAASVVSLTALGIVIIFLLTAAWVYSVPQARPALDRISFRLMLSALFFEFGYDLCYLFTWDKVGQNPSNRMGLGMC